MVPSSQADDACKDDICDRVAQLVEHPTFNRVVVGSNPTAITISPPIPTMFSVLLAHTDWVKFAPLQ